MTNVLWFSRHDMTKDQIEGLVKKLGDIRLTKVDKTIAVGYELSKGIEENDVIAIVAPIELQKQILDIAGNKPVIIAKANRVVDEDGRVIFQHDHWKRLLKVEIMVEYFAD